MINSLIHYEVELATRQQEQLRRKAALWHPTREAETDGLRLRRPHWLRFGLAVVAAVFGSAASANLPNHL